MGLRRLVKDHPVATALILLGGFGVLASLALVFSQGTFVDDNGCSYTPLNNPEGGNFTSISQVESFYDGGIPSDMLLEERDGVVYHSVKDECGTVGGGN